MILNYIQVKKQIVKNVDFDLSEEIKEYNEDTYEKIVWYLTAIPYFPRKSVDPKLYEEFRRGYSSIIPKKISEKNF